jgi:hypothetical protein
VITVMPHAPFAHNPPASAHATVSQPSEESGVAASIECAASTIGPTVGESPSLGDSNVQAANTKNNDQRIPPCSLGRAAGVT